MKALLWAQPHSKSVSAHHPGAVNHTSSSFGATSFAGVGNPATTSAIAVADFFAQQPVHDIS